uniref:Transcriptional adapter n=1 Tax=Rhodnius neglectus TaxID=72488 RepID=A0A0P4VP64_9HEMI
MASDLFTKFNCTYCLDDIVGLRVKCVECTDFDLCLQCFSAGAEIGPHKNDHSYQFVDSGAVDIIRSKSKWSAKEELLLLNGIEQYGFGNWENISQHIKTRTADEARDEYMSRYVDGSIGRATWPEAYEKRAKLADLIKDELPSSTAITHTVPPIDIHPGDSSQLGYMPHRDDFDCEYANEAETLVSSLNISSTDDDEMDTALKLAQVDMYIEKLRERARRKRVCRDYQLVSQFFAARRDRPRHRHYSNGEQDTEDKLRCLCQFQTAQEHACLVKNVQRQRDLERRLSELMRYRKNGLTRMEELPHFEHEAKSSFYAQLSEPNTEKKKRRKRRGRSLFHHKKLHVPHRQPYLIARARAMAAAAAAAAGRNHSPASL